MRNGKLIAFIVVFTLLSAGLCAQSFTNKGKEFWVGYGTNGLFSPSNTQEMVLYLTADEEADVIVSIPGTSYRVPYHVPANTSLPTSPLPKSGVNDCRLTGEGLFTRSIHIESSVPIAVFQHTYGSYTSGASMLLPVEVYGYTYNSLNSGQGGSESSFRSFFYVIASEDNTKVEITPIQRTLSGQGARVTFPVLLKKGEIFNVIGGGAYSMAGSKIKSVPGSDGKCHPVAVFSGSTRTTIALSGALQNGSDFMMTQAFPVSGWGLQYLTAPTSASDDVRKPNRNLYRIFIREDTDVRINGVKVADIPLSLQFTSYYEYTSSTADLITADKPIMVVQIIPSQDATAYQGQGDPELINISPVEQAIKKVIFYSNRTEAISANFLTLIVPESGMASLRIDGLPGYDHSYVHPNMPGYRVVVKQLPLTPMQHSAESDAAFTGITYGLGQYESYGYNAGTHMNNLAAYPEITPRNSSETYNYVCTKTPFHLSIRTLYRPSSITLHLSELTNITPATDVTINNPQPSGTTQLNGRTYYTYELKDEYQFSKAGEYALPVSVTDASIDNCSSSEIVTMTIPVHQGPSGDFTAFDVCKGEETKLTYVPVGTDARFHKWYFGDNTTDAVNVNVNKAYNVAGKYDVKLEVIRDLDGCLGDTIKTIAVAPAPSVGFSLPEIICMPDGGAAFANKTTVPAGMSSVVYEWSFGDGEKAADKDPSHAYASAGSYNVKLKATGGGCADSLTQPLPASRFVKKPELAFALSDTAFCAGATARFLNKSVVDATHATTWKWTKGNGGTGAEKDFSSVYTTAGEYKITLAATTSGCTVDAKDTLFRVYAVPKVEAGPDFVKESEEAVILKATVSDMTATLKWTPATGLSSDQVLNPAAKAETTQLYYLKATGKAGCSAYDSVLVKIYNPIKVPNTFSPNGDGIHDQWLIAGLQDYGNARLEVYNRFGQLVYASTGYMQPWKGTASNGQPLPAGTYYYILRPNKAGTENMTGAVTIIR